VNAMLPEARLNDPAGWAMAEVMFDELRRIGDDGVGITREAFAIGEQAAMELIDRTARARGLLTERDDAANLVVTLQGSEPDLPFVACGSHVDSVPQGGNFDGAAGVLAGLMALARLKQDGIVPRRTIKLYAMRCEESAFFGRALVGSSALLGQLSDADLNLPHVKTGRLLRNAMREVGADVARIARGEMLLDPATVDAWFELHIEQGPVLVARDVPVAAVTGIRGNVRHRAVVCHGEPGHSGAVPRWLRHDAMFAVAELLHVVDQHWQQAIENGEDLVVTTGVVGTDPAEHAMSRIPGKVSFSFEMRSQSQETLERFHALFLAECARISTERGVRFDTGRRVDVLPAVMDPDLVEVMRGAIRAAGIEDETIASGAGHDSTSFALAGIPSVMLFVRNEHGSHNPREAMTMEDFMQGADILRNAITERAQRA